MKFQDSAVLELMASYIVSLGKSLRYGISDGNGGKFPNLRYKANKLCILINWPTQETLPMNMHQLILQDVYPITGCIIDTSETLLSNPVHTKNKLKLN